MSEPQPLPGTQTGLRASIALTAVLAAVHLGKVFRSGTQDLVVLEGLDLAVERGELVAVVGESGAGKSTLLHILAALDTPSNGAVYSNGRNLADFTDADRARYRNREVGFVWQFHNLLLEFTAAENVTLPLLVRGERFEKACRTAASWLGEVGLKDRAHHRAGELSGGEQQRVALARALVGEPTFLLADEPTGNLDTKNAEAVFDLIARLHRSHRLTSLIATHNLALAQRCDRGLKLSGGRLCPVERERMT